MRQAIKMIAVDLDGTLLQSDKTISPFTQTVLRSCREKGIRVVCATGRGGSAATHAPPSLFDGRVLMNGAVAYAAQERVYSRFVTMDTARSLLLACDQYGLKTAAEMSGMHYSNFNVRKVWNNIRNYQRTDFSSHELAAEKLYAIVNNASDVAFIEEHMPDELYLSVSRDNLAMIMHRDATKMKAVAAVAAHWGIGAEEIVAFGDDRNDIDMLSGCGIGVAMGNAVDAVKAAADEECETNDNDGVAKWLAHHI
jgi:Cof subfamily protein (haloacid dehalogenase superfamily)